MASDAETEAASPPPRRALANGFIALFLLVQIAVPLTYYLGERVEDERFGWRMFSTIRLRRCSVMAADHTAGSDGGQVVPLNRTLHVAWINLMKRGRSPVVDEYLSQRCAQSGAAEVVVERRCSDTDGSALPPDRIIMTCASGEVREAP